MRKKPEKPTGLRFEYPPEFERLWSAYPKTKSGSKWGAFEAWWQLDLTYAENVELIAHVTQRCRDDVKWTEGKYIPMLSTFLNGRRWDDDYMRVSQQPRSRVEQANEEFEREYSQPVEQTKTPEEVRAMLERTGLVH